MEEREIEGVFGRVVGTITGRRIEVRSGTPLFEQVCINNYFSYCIHTVKRIKKEDEGELYTFLRWIGERE